MVGFLAFFEPARGQEPQNGHLFVCKQQHEQQRKTYFLGQLTGHHIVVLAQVGEVIGRLEFTGFPWFRVTNAVLNKEILDCGTHFE